MKKLISDIWRFFKATPIGRLIRFLVPQWLINLLEHLPIAILANIVYGFPSKKLEIIGVTGTDGKTTTVNMIYQILKAASKKVSMVSTINAFIGGKKYDTGFHVTSPDPFMVQKFARKAVDSDDEYLVLEVTSHALDQFRFWGVKFDIGVVTNITHEHLDYHKTWTNYFLTKAKLIKRCQVAILNRDEKHFEKLAKKTQGKVLSFGLSERADFNPRNFPLELKIPGEFNLLNGLAAAATASALGVEKKVIKKTLGLFIGLVGRMEEIKNNRGIKVVIDFAHTPNGLKQTLKTLRSNLRGCRLISLIGCEGYRDVGKRAMMGEIAQKLSDIVIVTAVDPRGELKVINEQIKKGAMLAGAKSGVNFYIIDDRQKAIHFAINQLAQKGDTVGIFGKGHERSMNIEGKVEIPWSDKEVTKRVLAYG